MDDCAYIFKLLQIILSSWLLGSQEEIILNPSIVKIFVVKYLGNGLERNEQPTGKQFITGTDPATQPHGRALGRQVMISVLALPDC